MSVTSHRLQMQNLCTHPMSKGIFHPDLQVSVKISRKKNLFTFEFVLDEDADDILFATPVAAPQRRDSLWKGTCFEAFFSVRESLSYWEINVSPSGDWNCYLFDRYRFNGRVERRLEMKHFQEFNFDEKAKVYRFTFDFTPIFVEGEPELNMGIAAVMEKKDHLKAYLALAHTDTAPNFHLRKSFILRI